MQVAFSRGADRAFRLKARLSRSWKMTSEVLSRSVILEVSNSCSKDSTEEESHMPAIRRAKGTGIRRKK